MSESESHVLLATQASRRRSTTPSSSSYYETITSRPLELEETGAFRFPNYSINMSTLKKNDDFPSWWTLVSQILLVGQPAARNQRRVSPYVNKKHGLWRNLATIVVAAFLFLTLLFFKLRQSSIVPTRNTADHTPEWKWYHYHYVPKPTNDRDDLNTDPVPHSLTSRNLLVAQMSGPGPLQDITDITSRPNRAYSKQWGVDFLRYSGRQGLSWECYNKLVVLDAILTRQEQSENDTSIGRRPGSTSSTHIHESSRRTYDAILFLPADSIITDLDFDLLSLLPQDKLVAIAGSTSLSLEENAVFDDFSTSDSGILMWNLNHPHSETASKLWLDLVQHPQIDRSCKDARDIGFLLTALEALTMNDEEDLSDVVQRLEEDTENGFVTPRVIKFVPSATSSSWEPRMNALVKNIYETTATLESVSDSVCYRYYPRCEVL